MDISEALASAAIPHTVDSRSKHREIPETGSALVSVYVIGDETGNALSKALALDECPLLFVTATGRVLVLRSGNTGTVALEAVGAPTDPQTAVLTEIGKASWEICKVPFKDFEYRPVSSRKKVKPDPVPDVEPVEVEIAAEEEIAADPVPDEVDSSEPTE
jgi:hypothetical protein